MILPLPVTGCTPLQGNIGQTKYTKSSIHLYSISREEEYDLEFLDDSYNYEKDDSKVSLTIIDKNLMH